MKAFCKLNIILIIGLISLLVSCDFSDSVIKKVKSFTTNIEENVEEERTKHKINEERLDSISHNLNLLEHRVYYVDCSGSMRTNQYKGQPLLDIVKDSLKTSLLNLDIDSVDIDIIPFFGKKWNDGKLTPFPTIHKRGLFSSADEDKIIKIIESISVRNENWATHHSVPINDFLSYRISDERQYHIMILLTDGQDLYNSRNDTAQSGKEVLEKIWSQKCKQKIYGIFVNLPEKEISGELPNYFKDNELSKLFFVKGVNFNINIFQLSNISDEVLLRKDSLIRIPFGGKMPEMITLSTEQDKYFRYEIDDKPQKNDKYLKIKVSATHDGKLPDTWSQKLHFKYNWGEHKQNTYNFPNEEIVSVTIVDEKTPKLELSGTDNDCKKRMILKRDLSYYRKWHDIGNDYSDTISLSLSYLYSKDVINDPAIKPGSIRIEGLPKYVCVLDSNSNDITNKDILLPKSQSGRLNLKFTLRLEDTLLNGDEVDFAKIRFIGVNDYKTIKWNNKRIDKTDDGYVVNAISLNVSENINPIEKVLRWLFILLLFSLFLLWVAIMFTRNFLLDKFSNNSPAFQFKTDPQYTKKGLNIDIDSLYDYKNRYQCSCITNIKIKNSSQKQDFTLISWGICNFWNLKLAFLGDTLLIYVNSHNFFDEIEMKPLKNGILVQVDSNSEAIEFNELGKYEDLHCPSVKDTDGSIVKLTATIYRNTIKNK